MYLGHKWIIILIAISSAAMLGDEVVVRHREGRIHGYLALRDVSDRLLASGTLMQSAVGNRVTTDLAFRFKDGSNFEETAVYTQARTFRLLTYRQVLKGPAFKTPMDLSLNAETGQVDIRYADDDGKEKTISERMKLPTDLANGMIPTLLGDIDPKVEKTTVSMLAATPKPRLVKLEVTPAGEDSFTVAGAGWKATRFRVKVDIGGVAGVVAPIVGKQPPDTHVWIAGGKAPGFVRSEGPIVADGPVWRIELASPMWPKGAAEADR